MRGVGIILLIVFAAACPNNVPPPPDRDVVAGTIDARSFEAISLIAEISAQGFLVVTAADYSVSCGNFVPNGEGRRVVIGIDEAHQQTGTLRLELPELAEVEASAIIHSAENSTPRSIVIRQGEVEISTLTDGRVAGRLSLTEATASISLTGPFDVPICPADS